MLRYIEHNPIKASLADKISEYPYALAFTLFTNGETIPCAKSSILIENFSIQGLAEFLGAKVSEEELSALEQEQKRKVSIEDEQIKIAHSKTLNERFQDTTSKQERQPRYHQSAQGHTQSSIAQHLQLSSSMICGVIKSEN